MGLLSFFRRDPASSAPADAPSTRKRGSKAAVQADHAEQVQALRQRARHRLIGAAVLVGVGIVAFPLVFETQPRPVPMDLPIVIPSQDSAAPIPAAAKSPALPASLPEAVQAQAPVEVPPPVDEGRAEAEPEKQAAERPEPAASATPPKREPKPEAQAAKKPESAGRYVVQVGAFADKKAAQEARQRLERKGLKTYAQVAQTKEGERIRVRLGPFSERADADKAAAAAKAVGLAGNVLTL